MIEIKDKTGKIVLSTSINSGSKRKYTLMKEDYITLKFSLDDPIYFKLGDGIDNELGVFELVDLYRPTYNERNGGYDYELRLDSYYMKWKNKKLFYTPESGAREASFCLTADIKTHGAVLLKNLAALGYTYKGKAFTISIDDSVKTDSIFIEYQNVNLIDALTRMAETFECEWWIIGETIKFGRCENSNQPIDLTFNDNVSKMSRADSQSTFATRIYAFGSERNIPRTYRRNLEFTASVDGVFLQDVKRPLLEKYFPQKDFIDIKPKKTVNVVVTPIEFKELTSNYNTYTQRTGVVFEGLRGLNKFTLEIKDATIKICSRQNKKINIDVSLYYGLAFVYTKESSIIKSFKNIEVTPEGVALKLDGLCDFSEDRTATDGGLFIRTYNMDGSPEDNSDGKYKISIESGKFITWGDRPCYNTSILIKNKQHKALYYPSLEGKTNIIRLPEDIIISNGDIYTIDNIIRSRVPASYFTAKSEITVEGIVTKRLMLPIDTPHIDAFTNMSKEDIVEEVVIFDDVYPQREGVMSEVESKKVFHEDEKGNKTDEFHLEYTFKDAGLKNFLKEYQIGEMHATMTYGKNNGRTFVVDFASSNETGTVFKIKPIQEGGRFIPDESLPLENGNKYVLDGYDVDLVSTTLIPEAEAKLKERALEYIEKLKIDPSTYECVLNPEYSYNGGKFRVFEAGERVNLINPAYFENGRQSRIIGYELNLDIPYDSPTYTVGETAPYSRIGALESKVDSLTYKGQTFTNNSPTVTDTNVYLIDTEDAQTPTDGNAFSALRTLKEIRDRSISKKEKDVAEKEITFKEGLTSSDLVKLLKGLQVEGGADIDNLRVFETIATKVIDAVSVSANKAEIVMAIVEHIQSSNYIEGALGKGHSLTVDEQGRSTLVVDNIHARKEAIFNKLTIAELQSVGGQIVLSAANMECLRIEDTGDAYRCFFDNQNGTIPNKFAKYDQARCQTFDGAKAKYYWRLVIGIGADYIDLSKTDCDGSSIPEARDAIVQLGNRTDLARQNAIILSAYGVPSIKQYDNIHSYSLDGCEVTVIGPEGNKLVGDLSVISGNKVVRVPADRGNYNSGDSYYYYDRVSHNGALWLCLVEEGTSTTSEPSIDNPIWQKQVREGHDTVYVQIITDRGNIMLNGQLETTLTAVVYRGEENITDQIAPNFFSWERTSSNPDGDIVFNESHKGYGKKLVVTSEDVVRRTQFDCIVNINF